MASRGQLQIRCFKGNSFIPVDNAKVTVTPIGEVAEVNGKTLDVVTDSSGQTIELEIDAPPIEFSQAPNENLPYSFVDIKVERDGFRPLFVK
jgi:hypothetical protein